MSVPPCKRASGTIYPHHFTIYLDEESAADVRAYAADSRVKLAVALRELVEFGLASQAEPAA